MTDEQKKELEDLRITAVRRMQNSCDLHAAAVEIVAAAHNLAMLHAAEAPSLSAHDVGEKITTDEMTLADMLEVMIASLPEHTCDFDGKECQQSTSVGRWSTHHDCVRAQVARTIASGLLRAAQVNGDCACLLCCA